MTSQHAGSNDLVSAQKLVGKHTKAFKSTTDPLTLKPRIIASMLLHAVGDTIGYKNGEWEFNEPPGGVREEDRAEFDKTRYDPNITRDRIFAFLFIGGVNNISLKNWGVSDDTILNLHTARALIDYIIKVKDDTKFERELFCDIVMKEYVSALDDLKGRHIGITTEQVLSQYKAGETWRDNPPVRMNETKGAGNGAAIRTIPFGLTFWAEKDRSQLIIMSLEASRITHNHPIGYLGGICSALFTAYAIEGRPIESWFEELQNNLRGKNSPLLKYLAETGGLKEYERDSPQWWMAWETYLQNFLKIGRDPITGINPVSRIKWFRDNIGFRFGDTGFVGRGGHDSVIIAYDSLISTYHEGTGWEKLLYLSALHSGDSDSTACIAGAWYGAMFGIGGVPSNMLEHLERREDLEIMGRSLFELSKNLHS
jgi:ADP-ribosylarginine hydrolase